MENEIWKWDLNLEFWDGNGRVKMCLRKLDFEIEMAQKVRLKKSLLKQPQRFPSNDAYATQSSDVAMATVVNCEELIPLKGTLHSKWLENKLVVIRWNVLLKEANHFTGNKPLS